MARGDERRPPNAPQPSQRPGLRLRHRIQGHQPASEEQEERPQGQKETEGTAGGEGEVETSQN